MKTAPESPGHPGIRKPPRNNRPLRLPAGGILIVFLIATILSSCRDQNCVFHQYRHVHEEGWLAQDTLHFEIPVTDTLSTYALELDLRNTTSYRYKDLYMMVEMEYGDSVFQPLTADIIRYPLTDETGKWKGSGWGTVLQNSLLLRTFFFAHPGQLRCKIYHKMNDCPLTGIKDVGLKLSRK